MATVLVVDDDEGVRQLVVMILQQKGHHILWAANGLEALMVYSSYRLNVDLVLTDIDMPQMNGIELAARIRARDPSRRILLMTGRGADKFQGADGYPMLAKPFVPAQLIRAVEEILMV